MLSKYILNRLNTAAQYSENSKMNKRHGAVLYNKKKMIDIGCNSYAFNKQTISCHAEERVLRSLYAISRFKKKQCLLWDSTDICC